MQNSLQFRISSALKNIIGSDLISDDFIAVFELVKNSYDAHATKVDVIFEDIYSKNAKIIIKDNGKGMNYDDLINKWLFVAYSAKKEGTEEDSYDYRHKIKVKRAYAGAKGIGRFSCDRLGKELYLETIKDELSPRIETLLTEWDKFEGNLRDEFVNISVLHETITQSNYEILHGTVLEISKLKSNWDRIKLIKLKESLARLINPNTLDKEDKFEINLVVNDEVKKDDEQKKKNLKQVNHLKSPLDPKQVDYFKIVNGKVRNLIFDTLDIKTTKIISEVSNQNEKQIKTTIFEGGKLVYQIIEKNPFEHLRNVKAEIYYMNRSAKVTFKRRMGVDAVEYGHIAVYKNGLRIYPYGERGADPLKMDNRKAQGTRRYIGTRETLGFIAIYEPNKNLRETSSRGDGLIKTPDYFDLYDWFYFTLRRAEKYIIDVVDWGNELSNSDYIKLNDNDRLSELNKLIRNLTKSKNLISFEVAPEIFEILDKKQEKSTKNTLSKIKKEIKSDDFDKEKVIDSISKIEKNLDDLKKASEEASEEALESLIKSEELESSLEAERKKGAFQGALIGTDKERIISLQHQVFHSSGRIHRNIKLLLRHLGKDNIDKKTQKHISVISKEAYKINSIARFITKANFNLKATEIKRDLVEFIESYLNEMYVYEDRIIDTKMQVLVESNATNHIAIFRPLEITTLIDIFISNSEKASSSEIIFIFNKKNDSLELIVQDNGNGISDKHLDSIFELGFTTTKGSGIGLFQAKDIIENEMKGEIKVEYSKTGATFKILIP